MITTVAPDYFKMRLDSGKRIYLCNMSAWRLFPEDLVSLSGRLIVLRLYAFESAHKHAYNRSMLMLARECLMSWQRMRDALKELDELGIISLSCKVNVTDDMSFTRNTKIKLTEKVLSRAKFKDASGRQRLVAVQNWMFEVNYSKVIDKRLEPTLFMCMLLLISMRLETWNSRESIALLRQRIGALQNGELVRRDRMLKYVKELRDTHELVICLIDKRMPGIDYVYHYQINHQIVSKLFDKSAEIARAKARILKSEENVPLQIISSSLDEALNESNIVEFTHSSNKGLL